MIYICIPAHNEQQTVGVVLWKLRQVFADFPRDYQLLVGDDASTDKTADVLEPYTRVLPLTVIRSDQKNGYPATLEMLLREAVRRSEYPKRDVVITLQADFSDEPDDLVPLLKRIEAGADVAAGNKVSKSKPTRMRRLSRSLASFFVRKLKLPEGLETPFDGYRAYRVYGVKRAIEERAGKRLLRFAGWAAHAELLRAVMPHARRVDVVDVVDRTDRMQRPRREQPFAAAMQVRALSSDREPPGLIGVDILDRIAATASRSRERGTVASMAEYAQRAPATNGGRNRQRPRGENRENRPRDGERQKSRPQTEGSVQRRARPQAEEGAPRRDRKTRPEGSQQQERRPRGAAAGGEESPRKRQGRRGGGQQQPAAEAVETPSGLTPDALVEAGAAVPADETAPARPKKKRRRRRRSSSGGAAAATGIPSEESASEAADDSAGEDGGESEVAAEATAATGEKKRRRRGGRRGGRGRKRAARAGTEAAGGDGGVATEGVSSNPAPPAEPPARSDNNGETGV